MSSSTAVVDFTNIANWQGVDDEPIDESENLITSGGVAKNGAYTEIYDYLKVITDKDNKILWAIKRDGTIYWGAGVPPQVMLELEEKVDKIEGKGLSTNDYNDTAKEIVDSNKYVAYFDFLSVVVDSNDRVLYGVKENGDFFFGAGIPSQILEVIPGSVGNDIVSLNDVVYTDIALKNLKRPSRSANTIKYTPFVLLHASDIHGDATNLNRIVEYKQHWSNYIDDALISGDMVKAIYEDGIAYYENNSAAHNIMLAIGNHDTAAKIDGETVWDAHVGQDSYNRYIKDYYTNWGNVTVIIDKCYYYKDYTDYAIRMIVTDCMEAASIDQQNWLESTLENTPEGYSVICVCHYPYYPKVTDTEHASPHIECSFDSRQNAPTTADAHIPDSFVAAVDNWLTADNKANAGRFICWLGGHTHTDYVCIAKDTNQLVITIDTAAHTSRNIAYSDMERVTGKKSQDLFNLVGIDTYQKLVKVVRVGADIDSWMRSKKTMCIQYASNDLYSLDNDTPRLIYCS